MKENRYRTELHLFVPNEKSYIQTVVVHAYSEACARRKINAWMKVKGHKSVSKFEIERLPWPAHRIEAGANKRILDKVG